MRKKSEIYLKILENIQEFNRRFEEKFRDNKFSVKFIENIRKYKEIYQKI